MWVVARQQQGTSGDSATARSSPPSSGVVQPLVLGSVQPCNKKMVLSLQSHLLIHMAIVTEVCQKSLMHVTMRLFLICLIIKPSLSCDGNPAVWVVAEENNEFGFETLDAAHS